MSKDFLSVVRPKEMSFICTWSRISAALPVVIQTNINQRYLRVLLTNLKSPKRYLLWPEKRPTFRDATTGFLPRNDVLDITAEIPY